MSLSLKMQLLVPYMETVVLTVLSLSRPKNGTEGKISVTYDGTVSYNEPFKIVHTISDYVQYMKFDE